MEKEYFFNKLLELNLLLLETQKRADIEAIRDMINHLIEDYRENIILKRDVEKVDGNLDLIY